MSKLPKEHSFIDFSDYGRSIARVIANSLKDTSFTPIHVTIGFIISGLLGVFCILNTYYWHAAFFLILNPLLRTNLPFTRSQKIVSFFKIFPIS